jgi:hypothetical protein
MLNQLVRQHPNVGALYPMRIEQALAARLFTPGQFEIVTALLSDVDKLDDDTTAGLAEIASRGLIVARGDEVTVVDTRRSVVQARQ